ncbi:MAG TPA: hypothetical protein VJL29_02100 [Thermoguttaceae bacterium]|nr:hypothetical protein [Thermoguttaceae bacterium]
MADVGACVATWDDRIANTAGRQIRLHMFWKAYSGLILGGSYSPTNGDGTTSWSYAERVWRDGVNYDGPWDGFDTTISYDTDAAGFNWNFGAENPSGSQIDFRSVVTHEIGHALGFFDSYDANYNDWGNAWGTESSPYAWAGYRGLTRWDQLLRDDAGNRPSSGGPGAPGDFNERDNPIWFTGTEAVEEYGANVPLYAPSTYASGSSLSHLNDAQFPDALMKHAISLGTVHREPLDVEWAIMRDLGWNIVPEPGAVVLLIGLIGGWLALGRRGRSSR